MSLKIPLISLRLEDSIHFLRDSMHFLKDYVDFHCKLNVSNVLEGYCYIDFLRACIEFLKNYIHFHKDSFDFLKLRSTTFLTGSIDSLQDSMDSPAESTDFLADSSDLQRILFPQGLYMYSPLRNLLVP